MIEVLEAFMLIGGVCIIAYAVTAAFLMAANDFKGRFAKSAKKLRAENRELKERLANLADEKAQALLDLKYFHSRFESEQWNVKQWEGFGMRLSSAFRHACHFVGKEGCPFSDYSLAKCRGDNGGCEYCVVSRLERRLQRLRGEL